MPIRRQPTTAERGQLYGYIFDSGAKGLDGVDPMSCKPHGTAGAGTLWPVRVVRPSGQDNVTVTESTS